MFSNKLSGRFLSLDRSLGEIDTIVERASRSAWSNDGPVVRLRRGLCRSDPPYDGRLDEERADLGYMDSGTGFFRLWIRQDERSVGRKPIQAMAAVMAREDGKLSRDLTKTEQQAYLDVAKQRLLERSIPRTKIIECLLSKAGGWIWIGDRAGYDQWARRLIFPVCGPVTPDPIAWGAGSSPGWEGLSRSSVTACLSSDGEELVLEPGVVLVEVRVKGSKIRCAVQGGDGSENAAWIRSSLGSILSDPSSSCSRMTWRVDRGGESVVVVLDEHGLVQAEPPASRRGMVKDRIERRFRDAREAAVTVGGAMRRAHARVASDRVGE